EREEIFKIHIARKKRDPKHFNIKELSSEAIEFTGAEIEEAVKEGMISAFSESREVTSDDILDALRNTSPLAVTMQEVIQQLRKWATHRAKFASSLALEEAAEEIKKQEKEEKDKGKIPHLKQEMQNPFMYQ
nr:AAA family ATPase [Candidatus Sigynarchaeota archaeon]